MRGAVREPVELGIRHRTAVVAEKRMSGAPRYPIGKNLSEQHRTGECTAEDAE